MKTNRRRRADSAGAMMTDQRVAGGAGAPAARQTPAELLRRVALTTFLFENVAYERGEAVAAQIAELVPQVDPQECAEIARTAAQDYRLRHVPLWIAVHMVRTSTHRPLVRRLLGDILTRADAMAELLALYWRVNGKGAPIANALKRGIADVLPRFDAYQLAKYAGERDEVSLADVIKLTHPRPPQGREAEFRAILERRAPPPDTWETALSRGEDKRATFERLMKERRLPILAAVRNINGMITAGIDPEDIIDYLDERNAGHVNPVALLTALMTTPDMFAPVLERKLDQVHQRVWFEGVTVLILDVSGSMSSGMSGHGSLQRIDLATYIAWMIARRSHQPLVYATAGWDGRREHQTQAISLASLSLREAMKLARDKMRELGGGGIFTRQAVEFVRRDLERQNVHAADVARLIVVSDSQDMDWGRAEPQPFAAFNAMANIGGHVYGVAYDGVWHVEISGMSPVVVEGLHLCEEALRASHQRRLDATTPRRQGAR